MEFEDKVIWSEKTFSINKVIAGRAKVDFPMLVKVTRGFYGIKEEDTVDTDQVLVFYGCGKEKCAMVRNEDGCGLSLPVNHTHKFHVVPGVKTETSVKKESEPRLLAEIHKSCKLPVKIRFDEETYTSFTVADKLRNSEEYGEMILESTHEVDYIEARPVDEGELHYDHIIFLPSYRDVRFMVAQNGDEIMKSFFGGAEKMKQPQKKLSEVSLSIVGYNDLSFSDAEYDTLSNATDVFADDDLKRGAQAKGGSALRDHYQSDIYDSVLPSQKLGASDGRYWSVNRGARRHEATRGNTIDKSGNISIKRAVSCSSMIVSPRRQVPPIPSHATAPPLTPLKPSRQGSGEVSSSTHSPKSPGPKSPVFTSFTEVPQDVSQMTINQVCSCLRLLKLEQFAHNFVDNQVDGRLLMEYSVEDLQLLGLNKIQAKKLEMFAKKNWRPLE